MYHTIPLSTKKFIAVTLCILCVPLLAYGYVRAAELYPLYFPPCGMKVFLHLYCPGCGGTRAVASLLHFRILRSLLENPLVLYMSAMALYYWGKALFLLIRSRKSPAQRHAPVVMTMHLSCLWGLLILLAVFFTARNVLLVCLRFDYLGELAGFY